jgi:hypothetical protein
MVKHKPLKTCAPPKLGWREYINSGEEKLLYHWDELISTGADAQLRFDTKFFLNIPSISTNNIARGMVRGGHKIRFRSPIIRFRFHNPKRLFHRCAPVRYFSTSPPNYPLRNGIAGARIFATAGSITQFGAASKLACSKPARPGAGTATESPYPYFLLSAIRPRWRAPPRCVLRWSSIESAVVK